MESFVHLTQNQFKEIKDRKKKSRFTVLLRLSAPIASKKAKTWRKVTAATTAMDLAIPIPISLHPSSHLKLEKLLDLSCGYLVPAN